MSLRIDHGKRSAQLGGDISATSIGRECGMSRPRAHEERRDDIVAIRIDNGNAVACFRRDINPTPVGTDGHAFRLDGAEQFRQFAAGFGHPLLNYEFGSTPRTNVTQGVYTSTEYPAHQSIPLHNEQAYSRDWPMKIWFYSMITATSGGETPIADSRTVLRSRVEAPRTLTTGYMMSSALAECGKPNAWPNS